MTFREQKLSKGYTSATEIQRPQRPRDTSDIWGLKVLVSVSLEPWSQPEKTQAVGRNPVGWRHGTGEEGHRAGAGVGGLQSLIHVGEFSEL